MNAVIMLARRVLRTSVARTALVIFVLATSLGFALFSATAARRSATAFDRFVVWADAADAVTGGSPGDGPPSDRFDEIEALPSVVDSQRNLGIGLSAAEVHGKVLPPSRFFAFTLDGEAAGRFDRVLVLEGAIPDQPTEDQGIIDFVTARQLNLDIGDVVTLLATTQEGAPPTKLPIEVVAIVSAPMSIPTVAGYQFNGIVMGPAFAAAHPELVDPFGSSLTLRLRDGLDSVDDLRQELDEAGIEIDLQDRGVFEVGAERLFTLEATTMWVAAVLALLVGLPVAYQLLRRDAAASRGTVKTVLAIGASRRQLALAATVRGVGMAALAGAIAVFGAVLASPLSPVGLARNAEVERGTYIDGAVLAIGVPLFVVAVAVVSLVAIARGAFTSPRTAPSERASRSHQPRVQMAVGMRMATGSRGAGAVAGIGALAFVSLLVVGIAVAASSLAAVPDDPEVSGGAWDGFILLAPGARPAVEEALSNEPDVAAYGPGGWATIAASGEDVYTLYLPDGMQSAIASGRAPRTDHEIALGAAAMERLGVQVGDEIPVSFPGYDVEPRELTVTGESIAAAPLFFSHAPDDSAVVAFQIDPTESDGSEAELVRFREGTGDPQEILEQVVAAMPEESVYFSFARGRRGDVVALEELEGLVRWILAMAAGLAVASLIHQVLVTHRRNASEMAVLRAMGLTGANVAETGAAHGSTLAAITAVVAIPGGLAVGSTAWRYLAGELVVLPRTRYDLSTIVGGGIAVVALASIVAATLAYWSARGPVAEALRSE